MLLLDNLEYLIKLEFPRFKAVFGDWLQNQILSFYKNSQIKREYFTTNCKLRKWSLTEILKIEDLSYTGLPSVSSVGADEAQGVYRILPSLGLYPINLGLQ